MKPTKSLLNVFKLRLKLRTVTEQEVECYGYSLDWVVECGGDLIAQLSLTFAGQEKARVYASENPGVAHLIALAQERGELKVLAG